MESKDASILQDEVQKFCPSLLNQLTDIVANQRPDFTLVDADGLLLSVCRRYMDRNTFAACVNCLILRGGTTRQATYRVSSVFRLFTVTDTYSKRELLEKTRRCLSIVASAVDVESLKREIETHVRRLKTSITGTCIRILVGTSAHVSTEHLDVSKYSMNDYIIGSTKSDDGSETPNPKGTRFFSAQHACLNVGVEPNVDFDHRTITSVMIPVTFVMRYGDKTKSIYTNIDVLRHSYVTQNPFPDACMKRSTITLRVRSASIRTLSLNSLVGWTLLPYANPLSQCSAHRTAALIPLAYVRTRGFTRDTLSELDRWQMFSPEKAENHLLRSYSVCLLRFYALLLETTRRNHDASALSTLFWRVYNVDRASKPARVYQKMSPTHLDGKVRRYTHGFFATADQAFVLNCKCIFSCVLNALQASYVLQTDASRSVATFITAASMET